MWCAGRRLADTRALASWDDDKLAYVVNVMIIKSVYQGNPVVAKATEYIDSHWMDEFDAGAVAKAVYIDQKHLNDLFKQDTGMKLVDYYKKIKVDHIKEILFKKDNMVTFSLHIVTFLWI